MFPAQHQRDPTKLSHVLSFCSSLVPSHLKWKPKSIWWPAMHCIGMPPPPRPLSPAALPLCSPGSSHTPTCCPWAPDRCWPQCPCTCSSFCLQVPFPSSTGLPHSLPSSLYSSVTFSVLFWLICILPIHPGFVFYLSIYTSLISIFYLFVFYIISLLH